MTRHEQQYEYVTYGEHSSLTVSYTPGLDGGGNTFGRAYAPFVRQHLAGVRSIFEWCAGPGFIGFSLLAAGLCETLDLGDVNPAAQAAVERTVKENGLEDRVRFHLSDCFTQVPPALRWDLMVGNPPHVNAAAPASEYQHSHSPLIWKDTDWSIHRDFYAAAPRFLNPGGSVVIQENLRFSDPSNFSSMIEESGLETVGVFPCGPKYEDYYFLWSRLPEETAR
ncbi:methyltransferase [Streptomyces sp. NPDC007983]|uniref:methyltransferase n=1 Tax=Streptomyces sp. NPDC007983 TaxID=3364800 RepID=UPI0036EEEB54